jgi:hypothetical protein
MDYFFSGVDVSSAFSAALLLASSAVKGLKIPLVTNAAEINLLV